MKFLHLSPLGGILKTPFGAVHVFVLFATIFVLIITTKRGRIVRKVEFETSQTEPELLARNKSALEKKGYTVETDTAEKVNRTSEGSQWWFFNKNETDEQ